jgi:hypothetical protein
MGFPLRPVLLFLAGAIAAGYVNGQTGGFAQGKSVRVPIPKGFVWNQAVTAAGGPVALTFGKVQYANGGVLPLNAVEIDVTEVDPPAGPFTDLIRQDLASASIERMEEMAVAGAGGARVSYTAAFTPELKYTGVAYYLPHGSTLYKFFLSYIAGDFSDQEMVAAFDRMVAGSQLGATKAQWLRFLEPPTVRAGSPAFAFDQTAPNAAQLEDYFKKKAPKLEGTGQDFVSLGKQYNVDPRLIAAIAGGETTFGKHVCAQNNAWNWFHRHTCPPSVFASYAEGIDRVSKFMRLSYINKGYDTIPKIRLKYCAVGCDNWIKLITQFHDEMPMAMPASVAPSNPSPVTSSPVPDKSAPSAPVPVKTAAKAPPAAPDNPGRLFGVPLFAVFYGGAAAVASMMLKLLGRAG